MYFGGSGSVGDSHARNKLTEHDKTIRKLAKRVAELETLTGILTDQVADLQAALKARDEAADTELDPLGILSDEQYDRLHLDLAEMAKQRRRAEVEAANWRMS